MECTSLKQLNLARNNIKSIRNESIPFSLNELHLRDNKLEEVDVSGLPNLTNLHIQKNPLTRMNLGEKSALKCLFVHHTKLEKIEYLPLNIEILQVDRNQIIEFDFQDLYHLKSLQIRGGTTTK